MLTFIIIGLFLYIISGGNEVVCKSFLKDLDKYMIAMFVMNDGIWINALRKNK